MLRPRPGKEHPIARDHGSAGVGRGILVASVDTFGGEPRRRGREQRLEAVGPKRRDAVLGLRAEDLAARELFESREVTAAHRLVRA